MPTLFRQGQTSGIDGDLKPPERPTTSLPSRNSGSSSKRGEMGSNRETQIRVEVRREFLRTTTKGTQDEAYTNPETLPSIEAAYNTFQRVYPKFAETRAVDDLRDREYFHLEESQHVCMDYCGFGLFSYYQQIVNKASSSFGLAYISANLNTHALYGAADEGTAEFYIRKRVMDYLNINDTEYTMVFTASRGSAFKLLAESYPFHLNPKLLTVYDFESEAVNWMAECAKQKGAKIMSACFKWPSLRIGTSHLKKLLQEKKKKGESAKGLFVFPVQSRMTGAKYSYQWMSEAQQNQWHVLLDASSLGPKDMDSLGLSLFRPDFIVSSFYKVFGIDPTGFGCLFIKNTAIHSLHTSSRARAVGMVRIVSLNNYTTEGTEVKESEDDGEDDLHERRFGLGQHNGHSEERSFSGPFFTAVEGEVKTKHKAKESNHRAWKAWKRSSKMERHNREHKNRQHSHITGSNDRTETVTRIGEGDVREAKFVAQPAKSRYFSETRDTEIEEEQSNRSEETVHVRDRARHLYERNEHDIQELRDGKVSEGWNSHQLSDPQWPSQGRVTGIQEERKSVEFQSLGGKGISPIWEGDMEDDQEVEECWGNKRRSKTSDSANESGGAHMMFSDSHRNGGPNEIEEDVVDYGRNSMIVLPRFDEKAVEDAGRMESSAVDEWQPGSGLGVNDTESEEILEPNLSAKRHQHDINEVTNVEELGELSDHFDDVEERNELRNPMSDAGSHSFVQARLQSFERRPSLNKHTGKQLSDFQEMGVQGLVNKFQNLHSGNASSKEFESTVDVTLDLLLDEGTQPGRTAGLSPDTSPRSPRGTDDVSKVAAMNDSQHKSSGQFDVGFEAASSNLSTATHSRSGNTLEVRGSVAENSPERATSETDFNIENLPCRDNAVNGLLHSSSFGRTPYESGEENYITILPGRTGKNWNKSVTENGIAARTSGSPELLEIKNISTSVTGQRENRQTMDDPSSPEKKLRADHAGEEEILLKNSRSSPSIKVDKNLPSMTTPIHHLTTEGSSADDISLNIADVHDAKGQGLENSRFDLRNDRTLSRNVDFVDELYPGRDNLASRRQSTALAEDIARLDEQDSDEESSFHSQHRSGSLHGYSTSGYQVDDVQPGSYGEGEDGDTEDEYDDIPEAESRESQGEPMISCKGLDFADSLGLTKLNYRLRYLINWLVNSLLKLRHPGPSQGAPLVRIYGPKVKYDRGAAVSFNIFDWKGVIIQPGLVQRLADRSNISLGVGRLCNIVDPEMSPDFLAEKEQLLGVDKNDKSGVDYSPGACKVDAVSIPVLTAAMGFVTSFEDVYKLWSFLAKFLDADHVSKEAWRYHSLNQQIMVM